MVLEFQRTNDIGTWDDRISSFGGSPFLSIGFLNSLEERNAREAIILDLLEGTEWRGGVSGLIILPSQTLVKTSGLFRSLLFYSGPVCTQPDREKEMMDALTKFVIKEGYASFTILEYDHPIPLEPPCPAFCIKKNGEYFISLEGSWEEVRSRIKRRIKDKYNRAKRNNLIFFMDRSPEKIEILSCLLEDTACCRSDRGYEEFNKNPIPHVVESNLKQMLENGSARVAYVADGNETLSMQFLITYGKRAYALFIGTSPRGYSLGANAMVFISAMERLHEEGMVLLNVGGNPKVGSEGLDFFKTGLGAERKECFGITSPFLQGPILKGITDLYKKIKR